VAWKLGGLLISFGFLNFGLIMDWKSANWKADFFIRGPQGRQIQQKKERKKERKKEKEKNPIR